MGHKYVKENETFNTSRNGTVPKPTQADVTNNKILQADGTWVAQSGGGGGASAMSDLTDVNISSLTDEQMLQYDSTTSKWVNVDPPASSSSIETLTDVDLDDLSDGQMLQYDDSSSKWVNVNPPAPPVTGVSDVEVNGESVVNEQGNAEIVSYKEVTQAEYNAMPDSKLTDGILYCIKDAPSGPDGFPPLIYDTVEREVGVWTDGKPVYQKTLILTENDFVKSNNWHWQYNYEDQISGYEKVIKMDAVMGITVWGSRHIITLGGDDYEGNSNTTYYFTLCNYYRLIALKGYPYNNASSSLANVTITYGILTIQYTKLTDTPGSGTWTKDGAYAHHYSTNEKVIGTWIDGKPLYEKTFQGTLTNPSTNSLINLVDLTSLNIETSCNINGVAHVYSTNLNFDRWLSTGINLIYQYNEDNKYICLVQSYSSQCTLDYIVTIQYTKTTD